MMTRNALCTLALLLASCTAGDQDTQTQTQQTVTSTATCMQDVWQQHGNTQSLGCTANDVRIAYATNIRGLDGQPLSRCIAGTTFSFVADFAVNLTAQARYDVGMYFSVDGDPNHDGALTGTCGVNTIAPKNGVFGSNNFVQLDNSPDTCGDIDGEHNPQLVTVQVDNVICQDADSSGTLDLPNCTSWRQPGTNEVCTSTYDAYPGSTSKCNCDIGFNVPVAVAPPEGQVTKRFVDVVCWEERIAVDRANTSLTSAVTLPTLTDSLYGDLTTVHDNVLATTCAAPTTPLPAGATYTCEFVGRVCGTLSETDRATATFLDDHGTSITRSSNQLTVDLIPTATSQP